MDIEKQDLLEQYHRYYVIDLAADDRTLMIPVSNAEEIGLRSISQKAALSQMWHTLCANAQTLPDDYKKRQKRIQEKLKTGDALKVAEVIRDLSTLKHEDHLTSYDTKLLERARQFLACEVALVQGMQISEAEQMISEILDSRMRLVGVHEGVVEEGTVVEAYQTTASDQGIRRIVKQVMKRLHLGNDNEEQEPTK
jgi:CarD family transcriptional regulator